MINPQNDSKFTEGQFKPLIDANSKWKGMMSEKPENGDLVLSHLKSSQMYLY